MAMCAFLCVTTAGLVDVHPADNRKDCSRGHGTVSSLLDTIPPAHSFSIHPSRQLSCYTHMKWPETRAVAWHGEVWRAA
jgi:hypothetical protein